MTQKNGVGVRKAELKESAPGGTRTPDPGLIRPMLYQTELPERTCRHPGSNQGPSDLQSDALPTEL